MPSPNLSRVTRAYVSGSNRALVHVGQFQRQERRTVTADFTGLLPTDDPIASVTWRCNAPWVLNMSSAAVDGRTTSVTADFQNGGYCGLKATITTDSGSKFTQVFDFTVRDAPIYPDDLPVSAGPFSLTATAP